VDGHQARANYKELQVAWPLFVITIPLQFIITYLYWNDLGDRPLSHFGFGMTTIVFILIYLTFYGMTTKVTDDTILVTFGIGFVRKRIAIKRIKNIEVVKTRWYYGYGIRYIPEGMLYNISGNSAVELNLSDSERVIRIGTKDAAKLKHKIEVRMI
jgi:hypothetical protein